MTPDNEQCDATDAPCTPPDDDMINGPGPINDVGTINYIPAAPPIAEDP